MKKPQLKLIEIIAKNLPQQGIVSNINAVVSGEDVLLTNKTEINGEEVEPEKDYIVGNRLIREVDHKGRLKKAFRKFGKTGLINYCKKYMKYDDAGRLEEVINIAF